MTFTTDPKERKEYPLVTGLLDYFPDALRAVANCSFVANEQHNPGQPLHWNRAKSTDHVDCLLRHLMERGTVDSDGVLHSAKVAWRALANLQEEIEVEESKKEKSETSAPTAARMEDYGYYKVPEGSAGIKDGVEVIYHSGAWIPKQMYLGK